MGGSNLSGDPPLLLLHLALDCETRCRQICRYMVHESVAFSYCQAMSANLEHTNLQVLVCLSCVLSVAVLPIISKTSKGMYESLQY